MNTAAVAAAMMAIGKNISFDDFIGGTFSLKNVPMVVPQKDGSYTLVRVYRGDDELIADLNAVDAEAQLAAWLNDVVLVLPNAKIEARYVTALESHGWA